MEQCIVYPNSVSAFVMYKFFILYPPHFLRSIGLYLHPRLTLGLLYTFNIVINSLYLLVVGTRVNIIGLAPQLLVSTPFDLLLYHSINLARIFPAILLI